MPEEMRAALANRCHSRRRHPFAYRAVNTGTGKRFIRRTHANKNVTNSGGLGTPVAEVLKQRIARLIHQRQQRVSSSLGMVDTQRLRMPIHVAQLEVRNLTRTEAIYGQKAEDGVVPQ